jgi:hypothetical protein
MPPIMSDKSPQQMYIGAQIYANNIRPYSIRIRYIFEKLNVIIRVRISGRKNNTKNDFHS